MKIIVAFYFLVWLYCFISDNEGCGLDEAT